MYSYRLKYYFFFVRRELIINLEVTRRKIQYISSQNQTFLIKATFLVDFAVQLKNYKIYLDIYSLFPYLILLFLLTYVTY